MTNVVQKLRDWPATGNGDGMDAAVVRRIMIEAAAEIARLQANQERMWCKACGTVTRDKQCDCTKFSDQDTQNLVNYADAMQEAAHEEAQENERLRAAIKPFAQTGWMTSDTEHTARTVVAHMHPESQYEIILSSEDFRRAERACEQNAPTKEI